MLSITSKHKHQCPNQPANACVTAQHSPSGLPGGFLLMEAGAGHAPPSPPPMPSTVPAPTDPFNWGLSLARSPRPHCVPWMPSRGLGTAGEAGLPGGNISHPRVCSGCSVGGAWLGQVLLRVQGGKARAPSPHPYFSLWALGRSLGSGKGWMLPELPLLVLWQGKNLICSRPCLRPFSGVSFLMGWKQTLTLSTGPG